MIDGSYFRELSSTLLFKRQSLNQEIHGRFTVHGIHKEDGTGMDMRKKGGRDLEIDPFFGISEDRMTRHHRGRNRGLRPLSIEVICTANNTSNR